MNRPVEAMVACGSGIATSTVAAEQIQEIFDELGIRVRITKCSITDIPTKQDEMDVIFVTNNYREKVQCPVVNVTSFITGIRKDKTIDKIKEVILEIQKHI